MYMHVEFSFFFSLEGYILKPFSLTIKEAIKLSHKALIRFE